MRVTDAGPHSEEEAQGASGVDAGLGGICPRLGTAQRAGGTLSARGGTSGSTSCFEEACATTGQACDGAPEDLHRRASSSIQGQGSQGSGGWGPTLRGGCAEPGAPAGRAGEAAVCRGQGAGGRGRGQGAGAPARHQEILCERWDSGHVGTAFPLTGGSDCRAARRPRQRPHWVVTHIPVCTPASGSAVPTGRPTARCTERGAQRWRTRQAPGARDPGARKTGAGIPEQGLQMWVASEERS